VGSFIYSFEEVYDVTALFFFKPLLHQEKKRLRNLLGSREAIDERTVKEKMTKKTKDNAKTATTTTPGQTKTTEIDNRADRTTGNEPEVKTSNKDSNHNQGTGPAETAATNSDKVAEVNRRTGETGPRPNPRRPSKTKRGRLRVRETVKGMRNRRFLY